MSFCNKLRYYVNDITVSFSFSIFFLFVCFFFIRHGASELNLLVYPNKETQYQHSQRTDTVWCYKIVKYILKRLKLVKIQFKKLTIIINNNNRSFINPLGNPKICNNFGSTSTTLINRCLFHYWVVGIHKQKDRFMHGAGWTVSLMPNSCWGVGKKQTKRPTMSSFVHKRHKTVR